MEEKNKGEKRWINGFRFLGVFFLIVFFLPWVKFTIWWAIGLESVRFTYTYVDVTMLIVGFVFVWGSANFGVWANKLGATIVDKVSKK